jgi:hypothetical protein
MTTMEAVLLGFWIPVFGYWFGVAIKGLLSLIGENLEGRG